MRITSPANPRFKFALRLRESRFRRRQGKFLVDGQREIARALLAGLELEALFVPLESEAAAAELWRQLLAAAGGEQGQRDSAIEQREDRFISQLEATLLTVPGGLLDRLAYGQRSEDWVAQFKTPRWELESLELPSCPLIVVLDRLEKPGNIGAILRSADAAGADAVLICDGSDDLFHPNIIRASSGVVFRLPIRQTTTETAQQWLRNRGICMLATRVDAECTLWDADWRKPTAILVGNEAEGLSESWRSQDIDPVRVPMAGMADSLNASVTTALCLFEAVRQRRG